MSKRIQRINSLIKKELSQLIFREMEFPPNVLVTTTRVETISNLTESKVFISAMPEEMTEKVLSLLNKNIFELQKRLNKRLKMRPIPKIRFIKERGVFEAGKIEEILTGLKKRGK